ncbi:reverse transcriptase [Ostertagia ostertagi]
MSSSLEDSELARLEKELLDGPSDSKENEVENTRKRRKDSTSSESSCYSSSSSTSTSSYSEDNSDGNNPRHRKEESRKKGFSTESPLEAIRIPRRIDFAGAVKEAPEIARMEYKKLRTRVEIDQKLLDHFNKCAAGVYVGTEDRLSFFDRLPLVSSGLAAPPVLDEGLPRKSFRIQVDESSLMADAEVLLNALNLMAIARSESRAGRSQRADLYIEQAMEVLSFGVEANVTRRRERFLRSFGVEPLKIVHNFHRFPVEEPIRSADLPWNEVCPALIGPKLTTEIVEKSQCRKLTEALVKEAKSKRTHSNGKRMKTFSSKKERLENHFAIHGYKLEFGDEKPRCSLHEKRSASLSDLLIAEVSKLLEKGAVEEIPWSSKVWTSSIFVIPKKDGGNRTVINLRPLNKFIKHHHFKLESIGLIRDLLERNDFMAKIDMKDAYFSVPIHSNYRKYLAFYCGGKLFQFKALPFGLSSAPYVYTRLMRVIASELRRCGIRLIVYLDDWLFIDNEKASLVAKINLIIHLFKKLGLTVNESKSQLEPSQIIEFLGVTINSKTFELSVPERKITSICNTARRIRKRRRVTLRDIARFIGQVNAVNMAASIPILFLRPLQSWLGRFHLKDANDYQKTMSNLPPACLHDLKWLSRNLDKMAHEPILHKNESLTITTDASNVGKSKRTSDGREKEAERRKKPKDHRSKKTHASKK